MNLKKNIISMNNMSKEEILNILELAKKIESSSIEDKLLSLNDKIIATLFFEPSTRTKMSFESASMRLGANILHFPPTEQSSLKKGESFSDTIKMIESYSDVIVIRHPNDGAAKLAATISKKPVINAGDGVNQHPSQTLLDLYTILKSKNTLDNLKIAFVGDLKYGRTVHSLTKALSYFNTKFYFISPKSLKIPSYIIEDLEKNNIEYEILEDYKDCLSEIDIFYMTRIQQERFSDINEYNKLKGTYIINKENIVGKCKEDLIILHPLPRVDEISTDLDDTIYAKYFEQAKNGIPTRQAMLINVLNREEKFSFKSISKDIVEENLVFTNSVKCKNKRCISNSENIEHKIIEIKENNSIKYKCYYCEKEFI